jgi:hypothetical protein
MTTVATLQHPALEATPGSTATTELFVRNSGDIVEAYQIQVIGEPANWAVAEPALVRLYPGAAAQVQVRFTPPRSPQVAPADHPYAVRVIPTEKPGDVAVPEGMIRILPFTDTFAEITPRHSKTTRRATHEVAVDNRGNVPVRARLDMAATDAELTARVRPQVLTVLPGQAGFASVDVRHRKRRWKGQSENRPFQVAVATEDEGPLLLDAGSVQKPVLAGATGKALAALLALLLLGAGLWFGLLKPAVESAAKDAAADSAQEVANEEPAGGGASNANGGGDSAAGESPGVEDGATPSPGATPTPSATPARPRPTTAPIANLNEPISVTTQLNRTGTGRYTVPSGKVLLITDMFIENPQGDRGRVDIFVNGRRTYTQSMGNFRTYDYHVQSPLEVTAGNRVELRVTCQEFGTRLAGTSGNRCRTFLTIVGELRNAPRR